LSAWKAAAACVGSDPSALPPVVGADASVEDGASAGAFSLRLAAPETVVMEGASTTAKVLVTRTSFKGAITITVSGLPNGVSADTVEIGAGGTEGTLTIKAVPGATQGTSTLELKGVADGAPDATTTLQLVVRGP